MSSEPTRYKHMPMIKALPDEGAVIVVPSHWIGRRILEDISELRGAELARRCKAVTIRSNDDCVKIMGLSSPLVIDWTFREAATHGLLAKVEHLKVGIEARRPTAA